MNKVWTLINNKTKLKSPDCVSSVPRPEARPLRCTRWFGPLLPLRCWGTVSTSIRGPHASPPLSGQSSHQGTLPRPGAERAGAELRTGWSSPGVGGVGMRVLVGMRVQWGWGCGCSCWRRRVRGSARRGWVGWGVASGGPGVTWPFLATPGSSRGRESLHLARRERCAWDRAPA